MASNQVRLNKSDMWFYFRVLDRNSGRLRDSQDDLKNWLRKFENVERAREYAMSLFNGRTDVLVAVSGFLAAQNVHLFLNHRGEIEFPMKLSEDAGGIAVIAVTLENEDGVKSNFQIGNPTLVGYEEDAMGYLGFFQLVCNVVDRLCFPGTTVPTGLYFVGRDQSGNKVYEIPLVQDLVG